MAQTTVAAAATARWDSSDIVVGTTPVKVSLYSTATGQAYGQAKARLQEKVVGGVYQRYDGKFTHKDEDQGVFLDQNHRSFLIEAPGTYRLSKEVTTNAIGAFTEDGT